MKISFDTVVVGGGVIGCAVAFELAREGVSVCLLDYSLPGRASSASAGGLWPLGEAIGLGCGVIYHANGDGPEPLPAAFQDFLSSSNALFPRLTEELRELTGVDIEFAEGDGLYFLMFEERERVLAERVLEALPPGAEWEMLSPEELVRRERHLSGESLGAVRLAGEHQVNPMLLAEAFKRAAVSRGARFRHHTRVSRIRVAGGRVQGVDIGDEFLPCHTVVNAAGSWAAELARSAGIDLPVFPVRGQIVLTETMPPVLKGCLSTSACYLCQKAHGEMLIGSTTERVGFDVSVTHDGIQSLCRGAVRAMPLLHKVQVKRTWAGLRPGTPDELPILGPVPGLTGYVNAAGGFRTGIVASPLTGRTVAQCVLQRTPAFCLKPFLLERFEKHAMV